MSTAGPWTAVRHGTRWTVEFVLDPDKTQPIYDTHQAAQTEADRRNQTYAKQHTPRPPQPVQTALPLNPQEAN